MYKPLFLILATMLVASACSAGTNTATTPPSANASAQSTAENAPAPVIAAIRKLAPHAQIQSATKTSIANFYLVIVQGQAVYVSADGRYMLQGNAYDLATQTDLADAKLDTLRRDALTKIPAAQMIRFAPVHPKYTVTVFTDLDCPYCRAFHARIDDYNKAGIAVNYLFWPRSGLDTSSYYKAISVWCAADRKSAFTEAKHGVDPKPAKCANPVKHDFELGVDLGVDGTPTIIAANGAMLPTYATPEQLLQWLQESPAPRDGG